MPKTLSVPELIGRIAEITSGPPTELVEAVVAALQAHQANYSMSRPGRRSAG
jgi:hypothetical protein